MIVAHETSSFWHLILNIQESPQTATNPGSFVGETALSSRAGAKNDIIADPRSLTARGEV